MLYIRMTSSLKSSSSYDASCLVPVHQVMERPKKTVSFKPAIRTYAQGSLVCIEQKNYNIIANWVTEN